MADTKALRTRIKSVNSTLHLTKAMGLVASSKIRRANEAMEKGRQYSSAVEGAVKILASCKECGTSPYLSRHDGEKTLLIVIAGDRGMAGGYNANVFRLVRDLDIDADIYPIGKRACDRYGEGTLSSENYFYRDAKALSDRLCRYFAEGKYAKIGIVYTKYVSMMTQNATLEYILPLESGTEECRGIVFEPDERTVLDAVIPEYTAGKLLGCVRESFASEVAARRMAMDSAGKNAQEMIDRLGLEYNRARQSSITQEITEIVAGSGS